MTPLIVDASIREELVAADPDCNDIIKKMLRGEDLRPWYYEDEGRWLIFTRRGIDIERYPAVREYLAAFRERLEPQPPDWSGASGSWPGRKPGPYKWYEIQDSVDYHEALRNRRSSGRTSPSCPVSRGMKGWRIRQRQGIHSHLRRTLGY
jgi:hypothetical protein